ncbi:AarF/ABC1/UbiB kinase family protein [Halalkalicoccus sp. NIPERK01]|uniref:ABC1 kinase family protein n=1 Tax=Halalkalicoccus sp. NIPERK01 TaxID=3053469 RepID=UPI00256EB9E0|nr:AarF/UbiB family protein [Halalkalicoccus sp. NIPERK01]MDL5363226.1 AarF/UbiB family protein [Halalkalicoccus sp. NIPERK01]
MLDLGPTFVKIGQVLSTRPDVVPQVYAEEFVTLQDAVPTGPYREMIPALADDVGYHSYDDFEPEPIAGGSLAQVYRATYQDDHVVVKVRRPGVKDLIETDLRIIRRLIPLVMLLAPARLQFSLRNMADDFERIILEELDFEREARMMAEIRANFERDGNETVVIPRVYQDVSSERVLTMAYVKGTKVTDVDELEAEGHDPSEVARDVANAYFTMGLEHGVYHGDPHPGNLAVDEEGRIVFYDFGMSGRFTSAMQNSVVNLYLAAVNRNVDGIIDELIALGALDPDADRAAVGHVLELVIDDLEGNETVNWQQIISEVTGMLHEFPFRIPPDIMLVLRVGSISEGVLRQLDPEFDFLAAAQAFLREHGFMERAARMKLEEMRGELEASLWALLRLPAKIEQELDAREQERIQVTARAQARDSRSLGYAILTAASLLGTALLATLDTTYILVGLGVTLVFLILFVASSET